MRRARIPIGLILFPLLMMVERLTHFGLKITLTELITGAVEQGGMGYSMSSVWYAFALMGGTGLLAMLGGGVAGIFFGARRVLVLALALTAVAYATLGFVTRESVMVSIGFLGAAGGLFLVSLYGAAAEQLAEARPMTLAALFAGLTLAANVGGFFASFFAMLLTGKLSSSGVMGGSSPWGLSPSFFADSALMMMAAGATALVVSLDRDPIAPAPVVPRPALGLLLLAAVMLPCYLIFALNVGPESSATRSQIRTSLLEFGAAFGAQLLVVVVLAALAATGSRASLLRPLGGGLLVSALGGALYLAGSDAAVHVFSILGRDIAEPLALTAIAFATPRRYAPGAFALWSVMCKVVATLAHYGGKEPSDWVIVVGMIGCLMAGALLLVRGRAIESARFQAEASASEAA